MTHRRLTIAAILALGAGCAPAAPPAPAPAPAEPPPAETVPARLPLAAPGGLADAVGKPVSLEARDLVFRLDGGEVRIPYMSGHLTPAKGGEVVDLEAPSSFEVTVDALEVVIPEQTLQNALAGGGTTLKELVVRTEGGSVLIEGKAGGVGLGFSFRADPGVTPGGGLGLQLEKAKVLGIGVRGFLDAFERPIEKAARRKVPMIDVEGDWLLIDPFPFAGPPAVRAKFTSVEVREGGIVARLGELSPREEAGAAGGITLTGGALRTKKVVTFDAAIRVIARDGGALVLDPTTMEAQIAGGLVKSLASGDYEVYVVAPGAEPVPAVSAPASGPAAPRKAPGEAEREVGAPAPG